MSTQSSAPSFINAAALAAKYAPRASYGWFVILGRELAWPKRVTDHEANRLAFKAYVECSGDKA